MLSSAMVAGMSQPPGVRLWGKSGILLALASYFLDTPKAAPTSKALGKVVLGSVADVRIQGGVCRQKHTTETQTLK